MLQNRKILAVIPARSGSKGIPDKNLQKLSGSSLIALAAQSIKDLTWIDARILSTDSEEYATEGKAAGLACDFLRPANLSTDFSPAIDAMVHALSTAEARYNTHFDVLLWIEPTSPLRTGAQIEESAELLLSSGADSVVTVSKVDTKFHPAKVFKGDSKSLEFYESRGASVTQRQSLEALTYRNGVCYALTRECVLEKKKVITEKSVPLLVDAPIVNIDEPIDLKWAEFLMKEIAK